MTEKTRTITCTVCAIGCPIDVRYEGSRITSLKNLGEPICDHGKRGEEHARREFTNPVRLLSTTLRVRGGVLSLAPVKTSAPVPKAMQFDIMRELAAVVVDAPIRMGDVLVKKVLGTGADIVATGSVPLG